MIASPLHGAELSPAFTRTGTGVGYRTTISAGEHLPNVLSVAVAARPVCTRCAAIVRGCHPADIAGLQPFPPRQGFVAGVEHIGAPSALALIAPPEPLPLHIDHENVYEGK